MVGTSCRYNRSYLKTIPVAEMGVQGILLLVCVYKLGNILRKKKIRSTAVLPLNGYNNSTRDSPPVMRGSKQDGEARANLVSDSRNENKVESGTNTVPKSSMNKNQRSLQHPVAGQQQSPQLAVFTHDGSAGKHILDNGEFQRFRQELSRSHCGRIFLMSIMYSISALVLNTLRLRGEVVMKDVVSTLLFSLSSTLHFVIMAVFTLKMYSTIIATSIHKKGKGNYYKAAYGVCALSIASNAAIYSTIFLAVFIKSLQPSVALLWSVVLVFVQPLSLYCLCINITILRKRIRKSAEYLKVRIAESKSPAPGSTTTPEGADDFAKRLKGLHSTLLRMTVVQVAFTLCVAVTWSLSIYGVVDTFSVPYTMVGWIIAPILVLLCIMTLKS